MLTGALIKIIGLGVSFLVSITWLPVVFNTNLGINATTTIGVVNTTTTLPFTFQTTELF
jgi:hypothetical protein